MSEYLVKILVQLLKQLEIEKMLKDVIQKGKEQLVCWLQKEAAASGTPLDDVAVQIIAKVLEVDPSKCKV